jgi:hypothetical protein
MLPLDTNVIIYVNVIICLMVAASIGSSLPPHSTYIEFRNVYL